VELLCAAFAFFQVQARRVEGVVTARGEGAGKQTGICSHYPENFLFRVIFIRASHILYVMVTNTITKIESSHVFKASM